MIDYMIKKNWDSLDSLRKRIKLCWEKYNDTG